MEVVYKLDVFLVAGKARAGKDTFAKVLKNMLENRGKRVLITHYADLVKWYCKQYFDWNGEKDVNGRTLLQLVGTEIFRRDNPDYWVNHVIQGVFYSQSNWDAVVIPDCRYLNEIDKSKWQKVIDYCQVHTIKITRPTNKDGLTVAQRNHSSETELDNFNSFDYIVPNIGTINDLNGSAEAILNYHRDNYKIEFMNVEIPKEGL